MNTKNARAAHLVAALALSTSSLAAQAVLPDGAVLQFVAGTDSYDSSGNPIGVSSGSYFAVDTNGNGKFAMLERIAIAMHDGIVIGASQPASGSHAGPVDGSESPGIDEPWNFFGNAGMFQTLSPVLDYGDGTLDFSGLGVTWAGIPNIPLGQIAHPSDTQRANIVCSSTPCQIGDTYVLEFRGHVPQGDPSGFGGVWFALHLEGTITGGPIGPRVVIRTTGGDQQECASHDGTPIAVNATVTLPPGDRLAAINWLLDGASVGSGEEIVATVPLGVHDLAAEVTTIGGLSTVARRQITVRDTQAPTMSAAFVDKQSGVAVTQVTDNTKVRIRAQAQDVCDPAPAVDAVLGVPVQDGSMIGIKVERGRANIAVSQIRLSVNGRDATGNAASASAVLNVSE